MKRGLVCFEEPEQPWTRVQGTYDLLRLDSGEQWDGEPHWEIKLNDNETTFVPAWAVVELPETP